MHKPHLIVSFLLVAPVVVAQTTASFTQYGIPCNGTPITQCETQNDTNPMLLVSTLNNEYAYAVLNNSTTPIQVIGFDVYTVTISAPTATVNTAVYRDLAGAGSTVHSLPDNTAEAFGTIEVSNTQNWYTTYTYPAVTVAPGEAFWIGQDCFLQVSPSHQGGGVGTQVAVSAWRRPPTVPNWAATGIVFNPIYRIRCLDGTPTAPTLGGTPPQLGGSFSATVSGGDPNSIGFLTYSFDDTTFIGLQTPVNLSLFGAPDCFAYTGSEIVTTIVLDPMGSGSAGFSVPNDPALDGVTWFNQGAAITNSGVNALGILTANAATAVVGI